jgi:predicted aspartyl protease
MMEGVVNLRREATLTVVVGNSNRQLQAIDTVIDTGFNGFLSLPSSIITTLNLPWSGSDFVTLGDGSETYDTKSLRFRSSSLIAAHFSR